MVKCIICNEDCYFCRWCNNEDEYCCGCNKNIKCEYCGCIIDNYEISGLLFYDECYICTQMKNEFVICFYCNQKQCRECKQLKY